MRVHEEVEGWYKIEAIKPDGSRRVLADWFPNLITDAGLEYMADASNWMQWCQVGSGSTAPKVLDTALAARIASSQTGSGTVSGAQSAEPYYCWIRTARRFAEGSAAGNLSEVGMGWASEGGLFSRAFILDSEGEPTTITVAADEILDVTYEFRFYPRLTDVTGSVSLGGNIGGTYDYIMRASQVTSTSGWSIGTAGSSMGQSGSAGNAYAHTGEIGSVTQTPSGQSSSASYIAGLPYSTNSLERKFSVTWDSSRGNLSGGIRSIYLKMGIGAFQFRVGLDGTDAPIPKTDQDELSLTFMHSWGRRA